VYQKSYLAYSNNLSIVFVPVSERCALQTR
jgi:hypothetical protein